MHSCQKWPPATKRRGKCTLGDGKYIPWTTSQRWGMATLVARATKRAVGFRREDANSAGGRCLHREASTAPLSAERVSVAKRSTHRSHQARHRECQTCQITCPQTKVSASDFIKRPHWHQGIVSTPQYPSFCIQVWAFEDAHGHSQGTKKKNCVCKMRLDPSRREQAAS